MGVGGGVVGYTNPTYQGEVDVFGVALDKDHFSLLEFLSHTKELGHTMTHVNSIPDEYELEVDEEMRSFRVKRRNKRNSYTRKKKTIPEEVPIGEVGVDRGFEDIGINKNDRYIGRLGGMSSILIAQM
ncbi:hypothetical protein H5410_045351 [Solanum commersonii]|uniref:Uncharacterized protein n=1 Tax=Solanum commersonii TaxID=4109 RepID=A0A9J5XBD1_SOLCO|nr:hypothetical protein H5410_045351 [Solanum commersonii]